VGLVALPARADEASDTTLFLLVRTGPSLSEKIIRDTLTLGLKTARCQYDGLEVQPLNPVLFEELERLIGEGAPPPPAAAEGISVRQLLARGSYWEIRLPKPTQQLRGLAIEYRKAGSKKYTLNAGDEAERYALIMPGSYAVQLLAGDEPVRCWVEVAELGGKPQPQELAWPQSDRFFAIVIRRFQGSQKALFEVIQDKEQLANPLENVKPLRNFSFVFASLDSRAGKLGGPLLEGNVYLPQVAGIEGRSPRRVWMLFPLTRDEAASALKEYRQHGSGELAEAIRKGGKMISDEQADVAVDAASGPRWFELVDRGDGKAFSRKIPLKDFRKLQEKYPSVWRLLVWEFDKGTPQAIAVQHPTDGRVYVIEEEVKGLPALFGERGSREGK
jgi:hypothetical protein